MSGFTAPQTEEQVDDRVRIGGVGARTAFDQVNPVHLPGTLHTIHS